MNKNRPDILLCMFRHGDTIKDINNDIICGQSNEMPLLFTGEQRAISLGRKLAAIGIQFNRLEVSPAKRSKDTARLAMNAAKCSIEPIEVSYIHEISQGEWEGGSRKVHGKEQREGIAATPWDFRAPGGGESLRDLIHRDQIHRGSLEKIYTETKEPLVVAAFTHGLTIAAAVGGLLGWSPYKIGGLEVPNCSATAITCYDYDWRVELIAQPAEALRQYVTDEAVAR